MIGRSVLDAALKANVAAGRSAISPFLRTGAAGAAAGMGIQFGYNALTGNQGGYKRAAMLGFVS